LRNKGDHDRALGIEVLVEQLFSKRLVMVNDWNGDEFEERAKEMDSKVQILRMLLNLSKLEDIKYERTIESKTPPHKPKKIKNSLTNPKKTKNPFKKFL
jgi:hypothetical protein